MPHPVHALHEESPALWGRLRRSLDRSALEPLSSAYAEAAAAGANYEPYPRRTPGSSFNPRAARISQVLWDDANCRDCQILAAAFFVGTSPVALRAAAVSEENQAAQQLALAALERREDPKSATPQQRLLLWALTLDDLRHYHLRAEPDPWILECAAHLVSCGEEEGALFQRTRYAFTRLENLRTV